MLAMAIKAAAIAFVLSVTTALPAFAQANRTIPKVFSFEELLALSQRNPVAPALEEKLEQVLTSPVVNNDATLAGVQPHHPSVNGLGPVLRVVSWNIERGIEFDLICLAFSDFNEFRRIASQRFGFDPNKLQSIESQAQTLRGADIIILNEVDLGMKRTDYRDVAKELAHALQMNYAFGVEFVEVDRLEHLGADPVELDNPDLARQMQEELRPDSARYRGLQGNAILSRYPILRARIARLPVCHDWFGDEQAEVSALEKGKRIAANKIFLARIEREVRRGGRMALIADVRVPGLLSESITVVSAHLENKCKPACRAKQMDALLLQVKSVDHPLILGGDLNTSGTDGTPTSIRRELMERVKNYEFWVTQALKWGTPASLPMLALAPIGYFKNYLDPTSVHLPLVGVNREARLFRCIERFRFNDHRAFDFRGEMARNLQGSEKTLANSNQRAGKGFEPTFAPKRDFGGLVGRYKLDWLLVSPYITEPRSKGMSYKFAPQFPSTMRDLNAIVPDGVSDHAPISIDLPFGEPAR